MRDSKIPQTIASLNTVLNAYAIYGQVENMLKLFDEITSMRSVRPNSFTYNTLMEGFLTYCFILLCTESP